MKKLFLLILPVMAVALCTGTQAFAQQRKMGAGVYFAVGSGPTAGIGGKFQYLITDHFRLEASPAVLFGGESGVLLTVLDLGIHAHYRFSVGNLRMKNQELPAYIYPLAGLGVYKATVSGEILWVKFKESTTRIGADLGAGFESYAPNKRASMFVETRLGVGNGWSRFTFRTGMAYHF